MNILTRYVLGELTKVFLVSLATLTLLMVIVGVVREAARNRSAAGPVDAADPLHPARRR